jgi:hypothetical protein
MKVDPQRNSNNDRILVPAILLAVIQVEHCIRKGFTVIEVI